ncbi:MAG: hypothetical protein GY929_20690 [Actinomycetia bacterium]|nr:hypothetical protein [Actinomycetes bacterium]
MGWFAAIAAVGGVVFWRRKTLKEDAEKAKAAGMGAVSKVTGRAGSSDEESCPGDADSAGEEPAADQAPAATDNGDETANEGKESESDDS